jgi:SAM-dependent methyltransferase
MGIPQKTMALARRVRSRMQRLTVRPPIGKVDFGSLKRLTPVSRVFGLDRGQCIDRYYIERFLAENVEDICGRVLEIGDSYYTGKFGGERVVKSDVLHAVDGNPNATILADLTKGDGIPPDAFDCVILTQTLPFIYDIHAAMRHVEQALKPGGVVLATLPGISQISRYDMDRWGDYWRFTTLSAKRLFGEVFPARSLEVQAHGNVFTAISFLHGIAAEELEQRELDYRDQDYELLITIRAVKGSSGK